MSRRLPQHALAQLLAIAARVGSNLVVPAILIAELGAERYGVWVLVSAFGLGGFYSFLDLGLQQATVKFAAQYAGQSRWSEYNGVAAFSQIAMLVMGSIAGALTAGVAALGPERLFKIPDDLQPLAAGLLYLIAARTLLHFVFSTPNALVRAADRIDVLRLADVVGTFAFVIGAALLIPAGHGLKSLASLDIAIAVIRGLFAQGLAMRLEPNLRVFAPIPATVRKEVIRFASGFLVVKLASLIFLSVDRAVIGVMIGTEALTHYDVAYKPHQLAMQLMDVFAAAILPIAAVAAAQSKNEEIRQLLVRGSRYTWTLALGVAAILAVLAEPFLTVWVGEQFAGDANLARLFLSHFAFIALIPVGQNILYGYGEVRPIARIALIVAGANLLVSVALAPRYGLFGVALGTVVSSFVSLVLHAPLFAARIGVTGRQLLMRVVGPALPTVVTAGGSVWAISYFRPPAGWFELAVYGATGVTLGIGVFAATGLDASERAAIGRRLRRNR